MSEIPAADVDLVAERTGASKPLTRFTLDRVDGDLAAAVERIESGLAERRLRSRVETLVDDHQGMDAAVESLLEVADGGGLTWTDVRDELDAGEWGRLIEAGVVVETDDEFRVVDSDAVADAAGVDAENGEKSFRERVEEIRERRSENDPSGREDPENGEKSFRERVEEIREQRDESDPGDPGNEEMSFRERVEEISGGRSESDATTRDDEPPQVDVELVAERTGVSEFRALRALEAVDGDLAAAVERIETDDGGSGSDGGTSFQDLVEETGEGDGNAQGSGEIDASGGAGKVDMSGGAGESDPATGSNGTDRDPVEGLAARRASGGSPIDDASVPDRIPTAPAVDVDHDALGEERRLGSGGNADVVAALHPGPNDQVTLAIKRPRVEGSLGRREIERLLAEAERWSELDGHDHVVGVVDWGDRPLPWIAMEHMDGGHLGERAAEMGVRQKLWTAARIAEGVRHAHRRGVAHLDLKPENVLFRRIDGAWDVPKVADWGLSKRLLEHSRSVDGLTPGYAAPEQFERDRGPTDDVTDVYGLGAVLYELFTGRPPFEGPATTVMYETLEGSPPAPSDVVDAPRGLDDVLLTALATDREDRYESALYLRDDLRTLYERV